MESNITSDNYKKFAAPYIGQIVFEWGYPQHCEQPDRVVELTGELIDRWLSCGRLRLKHIALLTEEEMFDIQRIKFPQIRVIKTMMEVPVGMTVAHDYKSSVDVYKYLIDHGYLVTDDQYIIDNWVNVIGAPEYEEKSSDIVG